MLCNRFFCCRTDGSHTEHASAAAACASASQNDFVWAAYASPEPEALNNLTDLFAISPLSLADCFDDDRIPKIDTFPGYSEILFNDFLPFSPAFGVEEINAFLGKSFLVTVFGDVTAASVAPEEILFSLSAEKNVRPPSSASLLHAILDRLVNGHFSAIEEVGDRIAAFEDSVMDGTEAVSAAELQGIRHALTLMRKSLVHEREILVRIGMKDSVYIPDALLAFYENLLDHISKYLDIVESSRESVTNLMQIKLSLTGNAMAEAANRTNASVSRLTFITTIFMPLTLLAGIGGMSEWTMMTGQQNWKVSYAILVGAMAVLALANFAILKRLERRKRKK
jgi:magnesium transporter